LKEPLKEPLKNPPLSPLSTSQENDGRKSERHRPGGHQEAQAAKPKKVLNGSASASAAFWQKRADAIERELATCDDEDRARELFGKLAELRSRI
jgi:hypothetical protein